MKNDPVNNMPYVRHMLSKFCRFRSHSNTCVHFCRTSGIIILYHSFAGVELMCVVFGGTNILVLPKILEWNGMPGIPTLSHSSVASLSLLFLSWRKSVHLRLHLSCCSSARCLRYNRFLVCFFGVSICFFMPIFYLISRHSPLWTCLCKRKML